MKDIELNKSLRWIWDIDNSAIITDNPESNCFRSAKKNNLSDKRKVYRNSEQTHEQCKELLSLF